MIRFASTKYKKYYACDELEMTKLNVFDMPYSYGKLVLLVILILTGLRNSIAHRMLHNHPMSNIEVVSCIIPANTLTQRFLTRVRVDFLVSQRLNGALNNVPVKQSTKPAAQCYYNNTQFI